MDDCIVGIDCPVSDSTEDVCRCFSSEVVGSPRGWTTSESKKDVESSAGEDPEHGKGEKIGHTESGGGANGESGDVGRHACVGRAVIVVVATRAAWDAPMAMPADSGHHAIIRKKQEKADNGKAPQKESDESQQAGGQSLPPPPPKQQAAKEKVSGPPPPPADHKPPSAIEIQTDDESDYDSEQDEIEERDQP